MPSFLFQAGLQEGEMGRPKEYCFGFVRFGDREKAARAVEGMNGSSVGGRRLLVKEASFGWSKRAVPRKSSNAKVSMLPTLAGHKNHEAGEYVTKSSVARPLTSGLLYSDVVKGQKPFYRQSNLGWKGCIGWKFGSGFQIV